MRLFTELVCRSSHRVPEVVNYKDESAVLGLRNNDAMVLFKKAFLEHKMCATGCYNSLDGFRLVHLTNFVSVDTSAVDYNFCFNGELFALGVKFVNAHASNDFSSIIFYETFELNVVGESGTGLPRSVPINGSCKENVKVHS